MRTKANYLNKVVTLSNCLILVALLFVPALSVGGSVYYVSGYQTNNPPNGTSWATAFPTVQQGINVATNGDAVWVAAATYFENIAFSNGVALYGGFNGVETALDQRNWVTNLTILDGRQSNSVVRVASGTNTTTRLDGFIVRNGRADYGGGIYCSGASPTIVNNQVLWNTATNNGGGIYFNSGSPVIASNVIHGNIASGNFAAAAGIGCVSASPKILNNRIVANTSFGGSFFSAAGGISINGGQSPEIQNNLILANSVTAIEVAASGALVRGTTAPKIINNTILWNGTPSNSIPAIYCDTNTAIIANNIVAFCSRGVRGVEGMNFNNNCVYGNTIDFIGFANPTGTNGNISVDPEFVSNLYYPGSHLSTSSPCRDTGDATFVSVGTRDIDGGERIVGATVDIGADEFENVAPAFVPQIVRVSPTGNDANDGKSWSNAKRTVQTAINQISLTGGEVWVRSGTYSNNLVLRHFTHLYGGFAGSEASRTQRNWKTNLTILDGQQAGSVVTARYIQNWGVLDGFLVRNGQATQGAGVYCENASPVIANNVITNNAGNGASSIGGGLYLFQSSSLVVSNIISLNKASYGGGISCAGYQSRPLISNNWLERNSALSGSLPLGGLGYGGGGIFTYDSASPVIEGNCLLRNIATNVLFSYFSGEGGGICVQSRAMPKILNNTLIANVASSAKGPYSEYGGGIYSYGSATIANNLIVFGSSGIFTVGGNNIQNNCIYGNGYNYLRMSDYTGTNGNISVDPLLQTTNDFHLTANSPCISSGNTNFVSATTDFDGNPRIVGGPVDIGAHEFQTPGSVISYAWLQQYGLPTDGSVDHADTDGDGANNWLEWQFNSVPTNSLSLPAPVFTVQPLGFSQAPGIPATFTVQVFGAPPISLQWSFNGSNIFGANESVFTITNVQATDVGKYGVVATNSFGSTISSNAMLEIGQIAAWGFVSPVPFGSTNVVAVAGGYDHSLWLKADGTVNVWSSSTINAYGELTIPASLSNVLAIDASDECGLALKSDNTVAAWGRQDQGDVPFGLTNVVAIALGSEHSLALKSDGNVVAWGWNGNNQASVPAGLSNVVAIAAGPFHNLALKSDGTVTAWGNSAHGQTTIPASLSNVIGIAAGYSYSLALKSDGSVVAWGSATTATNIPAGLANVVAIASGDDHCLALKTDGTVAAWGRYNSGQTNAPSGLTNVVAISAGSWHSLALVDDAPPVTQAILSNPVLGSNSFSVSLPTQSGRVYALEYADSLNASTWSRLPLVAGNGTNLTLLDATATNSSSRFYRVRRW